MSATIGLFLQIAVAVQAPDTVVARDAVPVLVRATAPGNTPPQLVPLQVNGAATLELTGNQVRVGGGFGQAVATRELRYLLRAAAPGRVTLLAPRAMLGADTVSAPPHPIVVLDVASAQVPAIVESATLDPARLVDFHALVTPDTVWAGQQVTVQAGVFIAEASRGRLRRNPEYVPSTVDGAVAYDLPLRLRELPVRTVGATRFRTFVFARALFPLRAGTLVVPPSRLNYGLGIGSALFGREETVALESERATIVVRTPPADGRPVEWDGAVGTYAMTGGIERRRARVGDAVPYAITISGAGNIKLLPAPRLAVDGVTVSAAGDVVQVDSSALLVRGARTFRYMLTPARSGRVAIGPVTFAYWDPARARYESLVLAPDTIEVTPGTVATTDSAEAEPALPLVSGAPWVADAPIADRAWYRVAAAVCVVALLLAMRAPRTRRPRARARTAAAQALRTADASAAVRRRALFDEVGALTGLAPGAAIDPPELRRRLRRAGVTAATADSVVALVSLFDEHVFGRAASAPSAADVERVLTQVRGELGDRRAAAPRRADARLVRIALAAGLVSLAGAAIAQSDADDAARAYAARDYDAAATRWASALTVRPRDPVTWANLGAAHWMRGDTAGAVLAWQRSARIAPVGTPVRDWLDASGVSAGGARATIAPVPPDLAALSVLGLGIVAGASMLLLRGRRGDVWRLVRVVIVAPLAIGAGLVVCASWSERAAGLAVVRRPTVLRVEPAVAGEIASRARSGDLATRERATGAWVLLRLADGRAGWVPADAAQPLDAVDARAVAAREARIARGEATP